ncbi:MAG: type IV secretion system protein [Myxococcota bacterium]
MTLASSAPLLGTLIGGGLDGLAAMAAVLDLPLAQFNFFGAPGLSDIVSEVETIANGFRNDFQNWGQSFYVLLFALQFLLLGATMVVKGPFAIATYRPIHALNPFANFFFFLLAGTLGYLFVANGHGFAQWVFNWFEAAGEATGCTRDISLLITSVDACDADGLARIGMQLSGIMLAFTEAAGNSGSNPISWIANSAGASTAVFSAFSVISIQLTITEAAFVLAVVTAPLFLSTIVAQPVSGIATGYLSFVMYLGVKLFVLKLVAGLMTIVADAWFDAILTQILGDVLSGLAGSLFGVGGGGGFEIGALFGFNLSLITTSLLFISLALYLPTKLAGMASQRLNLDLNGILFRGDFPVQIA